MTAAIFIILIILVTAFAVRQDFSFYKNKKRAIILILSGLLLIGFVSKPEIWPSSSARYALLTDGSNGQQLSKSNYDTVYSLRATDKNKSERNWLSSVSLLADFIAQGSSVDIYGYGISEKLPASFVWGNQLQKPEKGLLLQEAPGEVEIGKEFSISIKPEGVSENDSLEIYKNGMRWHSRKLESASPISLADELNSEGPVSYDFEWMAEDTLIRESWNIRGIPTERLAIGIMTYSPSFEINYLAGHLGQRGHRILQRSRIGQDRFRFDAVNAASGEAEFLIDNLHDLDLLILDSHEFLQLNNAEQEKIKESVELGLDVLMTSPDSDFIQEWTKVFSELSGENIGLEAINRLEERNWLPDFIHSEDETIPGIPLLNMKFTGISDGGIILHEYAGNEAVSVQHQNKNGKITGHIFYQSYSWLIGEKQERYNQFWSDYLGQIITREDSPVEIFPQIPRKHHRMMFYIAQPQDSLINVRSVLEAESYSLPMVFSQIHPNVAAAEFWPGNSGWHFLDAGNQRKWFYVYSDDWKFDSDFQKYRQSQNSILKQQETSEVPSAQNKTAIPNWIWLIGFLMLQMVLWAERKVG
ncbi:MAG: hypothetical protein WD059_02945 [Balneolaceae bacterium]